MLKVMLRVVLIAILCTSLCNPDTVSQQSTVRSVESYKIKAMRLSRMQLSQSAPTPLTQSKPSLQTVQASIVPSTCNQAHTP
jgi:hypothetical protein